MSESRRGLLYGVAAYGLWGAFPLYFKLLEASGAPEILAHRILWTSVTMGILVVLLARRTQLRAILASTRTRTYLLVGAVVIGVNWVAYIWGVNNGHVVEASLGYFINPLVTVLMGVLLLGETLRPLQWGAVAVATAAVVVLSVDYGRLPWVALVLACSFGTYGLAKKQADAGPVESLAFETLALVPLAAAYVGWLVATGQSGFTAHGLDHTVLLVSTGAVTALPLICFGAAAVRLSLVSLGLLQYLTPLLQFLAGVLIFDEAMPLGRWIGFAMVWVALAVFTFESITHRRRQLRLSTEASAV